MFNFIKFGCEIRGGVSFVFFFGGVACDIQKKHVRLLFLMRVRYQLYETLRFATLRWFGKTRKHILTLNGGFFMVIFIPWDRIRKKTPEKQTQVA